MNWILKNKNKSKKTLLAVLFLVSFFSLFYFSINIVKAQTAAEQQAANAVQQKINSTGSAFGTPGSVGYDPAKQNEPQGTSTVVPGKAAASVQPNDYKKPMAGTCSFGDFECYFKKMLIGVFNAVGWLFAIAATLFTWVIDPANISGEGTGVLQKQAVKDVWIMVRDLLNMTFILILLFAAFCTIFQVEKWNLKKVWLNILINALLVNFSYPIARFFIDVSNVAFYYFVNNLFTSTGTTVVDGSSIMASFGAASNLGTILKPENYAAFSVAYLIAMIVVVFIMGMTLLVVAALFLVRLIALTMLVMFSPIGFVGYIFPSTTSFADDWWKKLFSYSFFAPIMIFGMAIALKITEAIGEENMRSFKAAASANTPMTESTFIANVTFVFIPITIIWGTIGIAQSLKIAGAEKVTKWAKDFSTWVGSNLSGYNAAHWVGTKAVPAISGAALKWGERNILGEKLSPRAWIEGWKQRSSDVDKRFLGKSTGGTRDLLNRLFEGVKTDYRQLAIDKDITERRKEMSDSTESSAYWLNNLKGLIGNDSESARKDLKAYFGIAYKNRDQDEIMGFIRNNYEAPILSGGKSFKDIGIKAKELGVGSWNIDQAVARILEASGEKEKQINKVIMDLGEVGAGNGSVGFGGADYNEEGELVRAKHKSHQAAATVGKFATVGEVQKLAQMIHRNNIVDEVEYKDKDGDTVMGINPEFDQLAAQNLLAPIKAHADRHNDSFYKWVGKPSAVLGMKKRLNEMLKDGVDTWDDKEKKVIKKSFSKELHQSANDWIDTMEDFAKTGKKRVKEDGK